MCNAPIKETRRRLSLVANGNASPVGGVFSLYVVFNQPALVEQHRSDRLTTSWPFRVAHEPVCKILLSHMLPLEP